MTPLTHSPHHLSHVHPLDHLPHPHPLLCAPPLTPAPLHFPLQLSTNALPSLPPALFELLALSELIVDSNALEYLPAELWTARSLAYVSLRANRLSSSRLGLPAEPQQQQLAPIRFLDLGENGLGSFPPVAQLKRLAELHLQKNRISELTPEHIKPLIGLQTLDLRDNDIGTLPPHLSQLGSLHSLSLSGNPLRSIPYHVQAKWAAWQLTYRCRGCFDCA